MPEPLISVSGLRGVVGDSLTPEVALRYACAFVGGLPAGPIVVTLDGRTTGPMLMDLVCGALTAAGREVVDGGVAATPTTGILVRQMGAAGGIQISASHNPPEYNGFKLFSGQGRVIPAAAGENVVARYAAQPAPWAPFDRVGARRPVADSSGEHLALLEKIVDLQMVRGRRFKVLLDANHGAGSLLGRRLLEMLGCHVELVGGTPDGRFIHPPEPTDENLKGVLPLVPEAKADVGFCVDPDADRLAVIDETGRYLGEEYTLALCVNHVLRQRAGAIVTNCSTSRMTQDLAAKYHAPFYRSRVGEANVVDQMLAHQAVLGGEGNGGVIDPRVGLVRDSFVGMAMLLEAMALRGMRAGELADELPRYEIFKTKIALPREKLAAGFDALERHFADATCDRLDGLRVDWPRQWFLVRPSNTEPIVRAFAEAPTAVEAARLCTEASEVLASV